MLFDTRNEMFLIALRQLGRFTPMGNTRTRMIEGKSPPFLKAGREFLFCLLAMSLLFSGGCALLLAGGATSTLKGFEYSIENTPDKSFTTSMSTLKLASVQALDEMALQPETPVPTKTGFRILAATPKLDIQVDLERVTDRVSRISVNAKKGFFRKDRATAAEIIRRTGAVIEQQVAKVETKTGKYSSPLILMVP